MPQASTVWRITALTGLVIMAAGAAVAAFDYYGILHVDSFDEAVFLPLLIGAVVYSVGLTGWAACLGRRSRARFAAANVLPLPLIGLGGALANANVHGIFPIFFFAAVPLFLVGITLGIMAIAARKR